MSGKDYVNMFAIVMIYGTVYYVFVKILQDFFKKK